MNTPKKSNLTAEQLKNLRSRLDDKHERIKAELKRLEENELPGLHRGEESNDGYGDDAKSDQIRQRLVEQIKRRRSDMRDIEAALDRMENGTYGIDVNTGEPIRLERLEALPTANTAI
jgi:RNA polymerase-binding transcription factor DksA